MSDEAARIRLAIGDHMLALEQAKNLSAGAISDLLPEPIDPLPMFAHGEKLNPPAWEHVD